MSDIATQYRIISNAAGWLPRVDRGRLRIDGRDRVSFLQALLTNEIAALAEGAGTLALYLTPQGRMIADLHVLIRPDCVIVDVPAALAGDLATTLDRLVFTEDVRITDQTAILAQLSVAGTRASQVIAAAMNVDGRALTELAVWSQLDLSGGFVVRTDDIAEGSWDVWCAASTADEVSRRLEHAGAARLTDEIVESLRIEDGRPRFGVDMSSDTIPLEAGLLDRAISQTKGCYVGQEVIIRVLHRGGGRVAKKLVRIAGEGSAAGPLPAAGADLMIDGQPVGKMTSAAVSARSGRVVALGYVHRDFAEPGRALSIVEPHGPSLPATIVGFAG